MNLLLAFVVAALFGTGSYLLLKRDLLRVAGGIMLISNSVILFIVAVGLTRGVAPILPIRAGVAVADPLVQAMSLTAIVISFGFTALLLSLIFHVFVTHGTVDQEDLAHAERLFEAELSKREDPL